MFSAKCVVGLVPLCYSLGVFGSKYVTKYASRVSHNAPTKKGRNWRNYKNLGMKSQPNARYLKDMADSAPSTSLLMKENFDVLNSSLDAAANTYNPRRHPSDLPSISTEDFEAHVDEFDYGRGLWGTLKKHAQRNLKKAKKAAGLKMKQKKSSELLELAPEEVVYIKREYPFLKKFNEEDLEKFFKAADQKKLKTLARKASDFNLGETSTWKDHWERFAGVFGSSVLFFALAEAYKHVMAFPEPQFPEALWCAENDTRGGLYLPGENPLHHEVKACIEFRGKIPQIRWVKNRFGNYYDPQLLSKENQWKESRPQIVHDYQDDGPVEKYEFRKEEFAKKMGKAGLSHDFTQVNEKLEELRKEHDGVMEASFLQLTPTKIEMSPQCAAAPVLHGCPAELDETRMATQRERYLNLRAKWKKDQMAFAQAGVSLAQGLLQDGSSMEAAADAIDMEKEMTDQVKAELEKIKAEVTRGH